MVVQYWLETGGEDVELDFLDATGKVIRSYSSKADSAARARAARRRGRLRVRRRRRASRTSKGVNTFLWNMRYPDASSFPGMILWAASVTGPLVPPGTYKVRMTVDGKPVGDGDVQGASPIRASRRRSPSGRSSRASRCRFAIGSRRRTTP